MRAEPRALLGQIPGLTLVDLPDSELCCGSAGVYNLLEPGMASQLLELKIARIVEAAGARVVAPDLLFVGTEFGLFVTVDGGKKWVPMKSGLPPIQVRDLAIHPRENDLIVATFGRGFWELQTGSVTAPSITGHPGNPVFATSATFTFSSTEQGSTFECQMDGAGFSACASDASVASFRPADRSVAGLSVSLSVFFREKWRKPTASLSTSDRPP